MVESNMTHKISFMGLSRVASSAFAVFFYVISSVGCVYSNKWLLSNVRNCNGIIPLIQQLIGAAIVRISLAITMILGLGENLKQATEETHPLVQKEDAKTFNSYFKLLINRYYYITPAAVCFSSTIILNNACLSYAKLSTYSVAKSTTLIWNVLFQYFILSVSLPLSTVLACILILTGVMVGSLDTSTLAPIAVIAGCLSSIFQALYNTFIARALPQIENDTSQVLLRNQELSSLLLIVYVLISGELVNFIKLSPCFNISSPFFTTSWLIFTLTTVFAALLNKFTFMVIGLTEPSTFSVIGFTKASLQTAGGWYFYKDPKSVKSVTSVLLTLGGSLIYGVTRGTKKTENEAEKSTNLQETRKLTLCSAASIGDIDPVYEEINGNRNIVKNETKNSFENKV